MIMKVIKPDKLEESTTLELFLKIYGGLHPRLVNTAKYQAIFPFEYKNEASQGDTYYGGLIKHIMGLQLKYGGGMVIDETRQLTGMDRPDSGHILTIRKVPLLVHTGLVTEEKYDSNSPEMDSTDAYHTDAYQEVNLSVWAPESQKAQAKEFLEDIVRTFPELRRS